MSEWQGAEIFLRALSLVRREHPRARIVFLGQGSELPHLKELAASEVPDAADFPGVVPPPEAARWLRGAAAALVSIKPGLGYDFAKPTKIYAATSCGTPVVFAGRGAGQELVTQERLGWAPGYEVAAVAAAMTAALSSPAPAEERARLAHWTEVHASLVAAARGAADATLRSAGVALAP
jgi:glycosyltransferase involved in cell wall biosynthesis